MPTAGYTNGSAQLSAVAQSQTEPLPSHSIYKLLLHFGYPDESRSALLSKLRRLRSVKFKLKRLQTMPYINNDGDSRLNNFPTEPKMYTAEPSSPEQQQNYLVIGGIGVILMGILIFIATTVS